MCLHVRNSSPVWALLCDIAGTWATEVRKMTKRLAPALLLLLVSAWAGWSQKNGATDQRPLSLDPVILRIARAQSGARYTLNGRVLPQPSLRALDQGLGTGAESRGLIIYLDAATTRKDLDDVRFAISKAQPAFVRVYKVTGGHLRRVYIESVAAPPPSGTSDHLCGPVALSVFRERGVPRYELNAVAVQRLSRRCLIRAVHRGCKPARGIIALFGEGTTQADVALVLSLAEKANASYLRAVESKAGGLRSLNLPPLVSQASNQSARGH